MNDSQSIVDILIKFGLLDAQNADAALQKLQLLDEQKRTGMLETLKAADATKELGTAEEAGAEHADKMHISHRALHQIIHLIGHVAGPQAGAALAGIGAAAMGGGGVMMGVYAFKLMFEAIQKAREESAKFTEDMTNGTFEKSCATMGAAVADLAGQMQKFADARAQQAQHEITIAQAYASQLAYLKALVAEQEKLLIAQDALNKAKIEQAEKTGQISPDQAVAQKAHMAIEEARHKRQAEKDKIKAELESKEGEQGTEEINQRGFDQARAATALALSQFKAHTKALGDDFGGTNDEFNKKRDAWAKNATTDPLGMFSSRKGTGVSVSGYASEEEADKDREKLERWKKEDSVASKTGSPETHQMDIKEALDKLALYDAAIKNMSLGRQQFLQGDPNQNAAAAEKQQKLVDLAAKAAKDADDNATRSEALRKEIEQLRLLNGPEIEKKKDAELALQIATILTKAVTDMTTGSGPEEQTGKFGLEAVKMRGLADKGAGNLNEDEIKQLEDFAYAFKFDKKEKDAGARIKNAKEAIDYVEANFGNDEQIFTIMEKFILLGEGANRQNKDTVKELLRINGLIDSLAIEMGIKIQHLSEHQDT